MNNTKQRMIGREMRDGVADAAPFLFSIFISFVLFGILGQEKGFDKIALILITGSMMSEPLQLTLLNTPAESLTLAGIAISALGANLRFLIFTLTIKKQLIGSATRHIPALMVMANAAFTLISMRQQNRAVGVAYTNTVCFSLYGGALIGTAVGFTAGVQLGHRLTEHASVVLAIFLCAQLGKMSLNRNVLYTMLLVITISVIQLSLFGSISLMLSLISTVACTYIYDRT